MYVGDDMNFDKLSYFVRVVEKGSITKAAISLNMTQPPLSKSIKDLEIELESKLFERHGKRLELTEAGKLLYEKGKNILLYSEKLVEEVKMLNNGKERIVNIGCSTVANITIIPKVIKKIREKNLNIQVNVFEGPSSYLIEQLRFKKIDIAFVRNIIEKNDDLEVKVLYTEPVYVALPKGHKFEGNKTVEIEKLKGEKFLLPHSTTGYGLAEYIIDACEVSGYSPTVSYWGTQNLPMLEMVSNNIGIAFVPASFKDISMLNLPTLLPLNSGSIHTRFNSVELKDGLSKTATEDFIELIYEVIEENYKDRKEINTIPFTKI